MLSINIFKSKHGLTQIILEHYCVIQENLLSDIGRTIDHDKDIPVVRYRNIAKYNKV